MMTKKYLINFLLIFIIFLLDRFVKILIIKKLELFEQQDIYLTSFLNLILIWNKGIAFGLLSFDESSAYHFITLIILVVILILVFMLYRSKGIERISYIFIIGGSVGNLFDRMYYGAVPDFIDFHLNNIHWFIFNIADIFISIGVICLIFAEIILKKKNI